MGGVGAVVGIIGKGRIEQFRELISSSRWRSSKCVIGKMYLVKRVGKSSIDVVVDPIGKRRVLVNKLLAKLQ
jgi:hypothetical protein